MSGQKINVAKSSIIISPCVRPIQAAHIRQQLGCNKASRTWKYLGVPISGGKLHKGDSQSIVSAIEGRIALYNSNYQSLGGRKTLS